MTAFRPLAPVALAAFLLGCSTSSGAASTTTNAGSSSSMTTTGAGGASTSAGGAGGASTSAGGAGGASTTAGGAGGASTSAGGAGGATSGGGAGGAAPCPISHTSNLTGVSIEASPAKCEFTLAEAAAGITIDYAVKVAADVDGVSPQPQDAGKCEGPGDSGLIVFEKLGGGGQSYCLCDVGLCGGVKIPPATLKTGEYPAKFTWDGKNWGGPSDTNNPEGAPFPAGDYVLDLSALGNVAGQAFEVRTTVTIRLVP
jgi:hypothetical protein